VREFLENLERTFHIRRRHSLCTSLVDNKEHVMTKPPPIPVDDPLQKQVPAKDDLVTDDGVPKDGYDLPIEGFKSDTAKPQKTGAQDVKTATGCG
jgi:hypothetical protein